MIATSKHKTVEQDGEGYQNIWSFVFLTERVEGM